MNVLIVDDDHLVRKGIMSMMPWDEFGLQVTGEAENGIKALQFLEHNPIDLILTDIAMPTMSGIELLREVRERYPGISVVMLTFHQDFEYVQDALRLGAIDYIAKVEMEKENMHDILGRILRRVRELAANPAGGAPAVPRSDGPAVPQGSERALLFVSLAGEGSELPGEWLPPERQHAVTQIDRGVWLLPETAEGEEREAEERMLRRRDPSGKWALVRVTGIREHNRKRLYSLLAEYASFYFFYEYRPGIDVYDLELDAMPDAQPIRQKELYRIGNRWSSLELVYDERLFRGLVEEVERVKPPVVKLESLFFGVLVQWEKYVPLELTVWFEREELPCWTEWVEWLDKVRKEIRLALLGFNYSEDVMAGVLRAVDYINRNLSLDLRLTEVAESVHISRSYFSECFKNITGKTFNEYIRDARIDYSKLLLSQTKDPIYRIAEKCGYPDEKYFSKVFRKKVGILPSEMRRRG